MASTYTKTQMLFEVAIKYEDDHAVFLVAFTKSLHKEVDLSD